MTTRRWGLLLVAAAAAWTIGGATLPVLGEEFRLLTSEEYGRAWPSAERMVSPSGGGCCANEFYDGDRLMGTMPAGPVVNYQGSGDPPFLMPNEFGSLSFTFRRGSLAVPGVILPWMAIDFLGGPLLDLDGDLMNGSRSLIPIQGQSAVTIPGTSSYIELTVDTDGGTVALGTIDATGTNEGSQGFGGDLAITVNLAAGTEPDGSQTGPINPDIDTRSGTITAFTGGGSLEGVYRIENLGFEIWQDTLYANSATASDLGTFQFLGTFRGWLVQRDPETGAFPALSGQGMGATAWPTVDVSQVGETFNTANGLAGGTATIISGFPGDDFNAPGNGGLALTDFSGDLGAYLDSVVVPLVQPLSDSFVYLESAGFGINNSADPVFLDTVGYDVVLVAASAPRIDGDFDRDSDVDLNDFARLQDCFTGSGPAGLNLPCPIADFDEDDDVDENDHAEFANRLVGPQ